MRYVLILIFLIHFAPLAFGQDVGSMGQMDLSSTVPPQWAQSKGFNDDSRSKAAKWLSETMGDENARKPAADSAPSDDSRPKSGQ